MQVQVLFEKWWARVVGALSLAFILWFSAVQFEGLVAFGELLIESVVVIPSSIQIVIDYYSTVATDQLVESMIVGAVFGSVATVVVYGAASGYWRTLVVSPLSGLIGLIGGIVAALLGLSLFTVVILMLAALFISELFLQPSARMFLSMQLVKLFGDRAFLRLFAGALLIGGVVGAIGAQILAYPMQHCTYAGEAPTVERGIGFLVTSVSALLLLLPVWTLAIRSGRRIDLGTSGYFKNAALPLAFLAPTLISLLVFLYYPAVQVATLSLNAVRGRQSRFNCLGNYVNLVQDAIYQNSFIVTLSLTVAIVLLSMSIALLIALLASQKVQGASIYRTLLIWPYALSPVVVGTIFLSMFRQGRTGLINYGVFELTGTTFNWLTEPTLAPWVVVFASVYNALGFNILFYIAGLQNIPQDLLEAAQIDGANIFQRFFRIKLPLLSPFTFFLLVTNVTYSFYGIYGAVDTLTQGGPPLGLAGARGGATDVLIYKLYEDAFAPSGQVGAAAAQSIILFLLVALITLLQFRYLENRVTYAD